MYLTQTDTTSEHKNSDVDMLRLGYGSFYPREIIRGFNNAEYTEKLPEEGGFSTVHKIYDCEYDCFYIMKISKKEFLQDKLLYRLNQG